MEVVVMASQVLPVSSSAAGWSRSTFAAAKSPSSSCGKKALCVSSSSARKGLDLGADLSLHGKGISQRMPTAGRKLHVSAAVAEDRRIEQESMLSEKPTTLLREGEDSDDKNGLRARFEQMVFRIQNDVCAAVEAIDGGKFREDAWSRPGGGGGVSRVLQGGTVWEKAGVNVSVVYGSMPPEAYRAATGAASTKPGRIPFFASGVSSVMHPINPMAPTVHFNYRYFETDAPEGVEGAPRAWWFGGGTDLTPSYFFEEDVKHFHQVQKNACDKFDPAFYPKYKKWCDDYFLIKHRGERRGLGGIFFDDLNDRDPNELLAFATACADSVIPAYIPLIEKRKDMAYTQEQKEWQQLRRGRYVEFNLVYDRGTTFGLQTGGRIESILMSLPLTARWEYDHHPEEGTEEAKLLDACKNPKEWLL
ncbi:coproporphyrinogen III oxidase [Marchantia polymorpha subsp. ruderalis]|uniref:coproporphyrinogen oxidase n=2 Tax=Marchantia polymorpha TaxID=3197 RepID=A0A176VWI0_MARPO|nr:hypothetical protein AXG93_1615s1590 [Marchantia polymorpha subsp. ruderalis]PTQ40546.1 hypothetical protein MARPO_0039s0053 [Marchantia polymorpha]BBN05978.1 hypothetical protein Mp_3g17410 [Marchantia polymorpha subsp. ruderalis]|eukprot:PTQ40546.1 hypothetical protein MARPO_0039s0053 [Marchantia polymorpha]